MKQSMRKNAHIFLKALCFLLLLAAIHTVDVSAQATVLKFGGDDVLSDSEGNLYGVRYSNYLNGSANYKFYAEYDSNGLHEATITSSNPDVVSVDSSYSSLSTYGTSCVRWARLHLNGYGKSTITVTTEGSSAQMTVYVISRKVSNASAKQSSVSKVQLDWQAVQGADGYRIASKESKSSEDATNDSTQYQQIAVAEGAATTSANVEASWEKAVSYQVLPYMLTPDGKTMLYYNTDTASTEYTLQAPNVVISNMQIVDSTNVRVTWDGNSEATGYELFAKSDTENEYQSVFKTSDATQTSCTYNGVAGKQVSFKLKVKFHGGLSTDSSPVSYYIPKAGAVCNTKLKLKQYDSFGQYGGNWSGSDTTYYYVANNKFHVVSVIGHKLYDYTLNSKTHKVAGKKIVNLGKYNVWGGFVQGTDGNFYVAVGYNNLKESKTKTVIKVKKYSSAWKLKKTCNIAGGSKNAFTGIYEPFEAGNCRMAQNGNELYVFTCRTMFKQSDGLHHQSNIAFQINTDNMTYVNHNDSYCSHSFNQYLRYDEDTLYLADHGDAYPRGIQLTKRDANGTQTSKTVFRIKGATGNNYTGVTVGGMEYSANRILIAGTSIPQNYNIKGVNKKRDKSVSNVFVSVTDKNLDSNKVVWLTHYTKKSKTSVSEVRTVKISDYNIAVLYTTTKKKDTKLHYVVLDNEGAVTYQKTYANMAFDGGTQPILNDGSIVWTAYTTDNNYNNILHYYSIPVTFGK